jgi:hypothetical protein
MGEGNPAADARGFPRRPSSDPGDADLPLAEWRGPLPLLAGLAAATIQRLAAASLPDSADVAAARRVGLGVARKISLMPVHVSFVVLSLTCVFALAACLRAGRRIASVPDDIIRLQIAGWSRSSLPLLGDTVLLYGRLARFQYYSNREASGINVPDD